MKGCQKVFSKNCRDVKNEAFGKKLYLFCLFYVGERQTENKEKTKIVKLPRKIVFGGGGEKVFFPKSVIVKNCKTRFVFGKWKGAFSSKLSVLVFFVASKNPENNTETGASAGTWGNQKPPFLAKRVFLEGVSKGCLLSVIHKSCAPLKTLFL